MYQHSFRNILSLHCRCYCLNGRGMWPWPYKDTQRKRSDGPHYFKGCDGCAMTSIVRMSAAVSDEVFVEVKQIIDTSRLCCFEEVKLGLGSDLPIAHC